MAASWQLLVRQSVTRNPVGVAGLCGIALVVLAAIIAPLLVSDAPLLRQTAAGGLESPWAESLLDVGRYPDAVDRLFNSALVVFGACLALFPLALLMRYWWFFRQADYWSTLATAALSATVVLWLVMALPAFRSVQPAERFAASPTAELEWYAPVADSLTASDDRPPHSLAVLLRGARTTVAVTALALVVAGGLAFLLGVLAGAWPGSLLDTCIRWLGDALSSVPAVLLGLAALAFVADPTPPILWGAGAGAVVAFPPLLRAIRRDVARESEADFIVIARANAPWTPGRALTELAPAALAPLAVSACFAASLVVTLEATLAFFGVLPNGDSWGRLLRSGFDRGDAIAALLGTAAIAVTVLSLHMAGEALAAARPTERRLRPRE